MFLAPIFLVGKRFADKPYLFHRHSKNDQLADFVSFGVRPFETGVLSH